MLLIFQPSHLILILMVLFNNTDVPGLGNWNITLHWLDVWNASMGANISTLNPMYKHQWGTAEIKCLLSLIGNTFLCKQVETLIKAVRSYFFHINIVQLFKLQSNQTSCFTRLKAMLLNRSIWYKNHVETIQRNSFQSNITYWILCQCIVLHLFNDDSRLL